MGGAKVGDAAEIGIEGGSSAAGNGFDGGDILIQEARERAKSPSVEAPTQSNLSEAASKNWEQYRSDQLDREAKASKYLTNVSMDRDINEFVDSRKETDLELISKLDDKDLKAIGGIGAALAKNDIKAAQEIFKQGYDKENYDYDSMNKLDVGLNSELQRRGLDGRWMIRIAYGPEDGHFQIIKDLSSQNSINHVMPIGK